MMLHIELTWLIGLLLSFLGAVAGLVKFWVAQSRAEQIQRDERLMAEIAELQAAMNKRLDHIERTDREEGQRLSANLSRLEREFLAFKADLPMTYLQRADHIRSESVTQARLDAIAAQLTNVQILIGGKPA